MPGKQTALTTRLEPSKRQLFQWHKVEQRPIAEVKRRMDELTEALISAGYDYNFVAEKGSWKSRSRYWNKLAKNAWMVETNQKGRALSIPTELANIPIWIEWGQDVGDWRKNKLEGKHPSQSQADEDEEDYGNTGHWDEQYQTSAVTGERGTFQGSHASLPQLPSTNIPSYPSDLTINPGTTVPYFNTETVPWPQQASIPFAAIPLPSLPQAQNALQDYTRGPVMYYQSYQTATPAPNALLPFSNSIHGNDHELVSYMSDMQPSGMRIESWPQQGSGSTVQDYTQKDRTSHRKDYA